MKNKKILALIILITSICFLICFFYFFIFKKNKNTEKCELRILKANLPYQYNCGIIEKENDRIVVLGKIKNIEISKDNILQIKVITSLSDSSKNISIYDFALGSKDKSIILIRFKNSREISDYPVNYKDIQFQLTKENLQKIKNEIPNHYAFFTIISPSSFLSQLYSTKNKEKKYKESLEFLKKYYSTCKSLETFINSPTESNFKKVKKDCNFFLVHYYITIFP